MCHHLAACVPGHRPTALRSVAKCTLCFQYSSCPAGDKLRLHDDGPGDGRLTCVGADQLPLHATLQAKAGASAVAVVTGPNSGPPDANSRNITVYNDAFEQLTNGGVQLAGYVYMSYGQRPVEDTLSDIRDWYAQHSDQLAGIFVDEAAVEVRRHMMLQQGRSVSDGADCQQSGCCNRCSTNALTSSGSRRNRSHL